MSTTVLTQQEQEEKKFWEGTNFWSNLALVFFSLWAGYTTTTGDVITETITQLFGGVFAVRQLLKNSMIDLRKWITSGNTWAYLTAVLAPIFGPWIADVLPLLQDLLNSILDGGNLNQILTAAVSFAISVFYLFRDRAGAQLAKVLNPSGNA